MNIIERFWGSYWTVLDKKTFKVKILSFNPEKECSMQRHRERNELWLFLSGTGKMLKKIGKQVVQQDIRAGDWYHVPRGEWHQYKSEKATVVLEIQYGDKCEEEDIEREI